MYIFIYIYIMLFNTFIAINVITGQWCFFRTSTSCMPIILSQDGAYPYYRIMHTEGRLE